MHLEYLVLPRAVFEQAHRHGLIFYPEGFAVWMGFTVLVDGKKVPAPNN